MHPTHLLCNLRNEELGRNKFWRIRYKAVLELEHLMLHEWCFDHPYLTRLHLLLNQLVLKYKSVAEAVVEKADQWKTLKKYEDADNIVVDSEVFLVNEIANLVSDDEREELETLADDIKMYTL